MKPLSFFIPLFFLTACAQSSAHLDEEAEKYHFMDGHYQVLVDKSTLYWEGFYPLGSHIGGLSLMQGELWIENNEPVYGSFKMDMNSITNTDLAGHEAETLVNQLKSDYFFATSKYPFSRFDITRIKPYQGFEDYNYVAEGDLALRGEDAPVEILVKLTQNDDRLTVYGKVVVDRTAFGMQVRSGSFFSDLGDQLVGDEFVVELDLVAQRKLEG